MIQKKQFTREDILAYLNGLKNSVLHTSTILHQINLILDWQKKDYRDEAQTEGLFFSYVFMCFHRVIVLELYKLLWNQEFMNLNQFLNELGKNYNIIKPLSFDNPVPSNTYLNSIKKHKKQLKDISHITNNIRELRNNLYAHSDQTYYNDHEKLGQDFPVNWNDLNTALEVIREIVREHYGYIFQSDLDMSKIHSTNNVTLYLKRSLGFERFWKNKNLNHLKKVEFLKETYNPDDIYLFPQGSNP